MFYLSVAEGRGGGLTVATAPCLVGQGGSRRLDSICVFVPVSQQVKPSQEGGGGFRAGNAFLAVVAQGVSISADRPSVLTTLASAAPSTHLIMHTYFYEFTFRFSRTYIYTPYIF